MANRSVGAPRVAAHDGSTQDGCTPDGDVGSRAGIRHRPSEPYAPRPGDLLADRLRALASWATRVDATTVVDGDRVDGAVLSQVAHAQQHAEGELLARWRSFRGFYAPYLVNVRKREVWMRRAIEAFENNHVDADSRRALRLCKLRRPPLAKVEAVVAAASTPLAPPPSASSRAPPSAITTPDTRRRGLRQGGE